MPHGEFGDTCLVFRWPKIPHQQGHAGTSNLDCGPLLADLRLINRVRPHDLDEEDVAYRVHFTALTMDRERGRHHHKSRRTP